MCSSIVPWGLITTAPPSGAHLTYYGGKVISNVKIVMVLYGAGTYASFITNDTAPSMVSFYQQVVNSSYLDCLCEYSTPTQTIGRGTFAGKSSITPAQANNGSTIDDSNIQAELVSQLAAGHLPAPDSNTLYMIHFPRGKSITLQGFRSCVAGGFCAYHGTTLSGSREIFYGVMPDMSPGSGCDIGCGGSATNFNNVCSVASHEIIESITDPEVGIASVIGFPLAWYDAVNGEIGDICNGMQATFRGTDGQTYTVQQGWSNHDNQCIAVRALLAPLANAQSVTNLQGSSSPITLTGVDPNVCPSPLTFLVTVNPIHGTLSGSAPALTYTSASNYAGPDSFQFLVNNGTLNSTPATVSITVASNQLTIRPLTSGNFRLTFPTLPNSAYRLQATDYLSNPIPWLTLLTTNSGTNRTVIFDDLQATNHSQRFYRTATP